MAAPFHANTQGISRHQRMHDFSANHIKSCKCVEDDDSSVDLGVTMINPAIGPIAEAPPFPAHSPLVHLPAGLVRKRPCQIIEKHHKGILGCDCPPKSMKQQKAQWLAARSVEKSSSHMMLNQVKGKNCWINNCRYCTLHSSLATKQPAAAHDSCSLRDQASVKKFQRTFSESFDNLAPRWVR